jgi:thiol-disulfide isomerase/thioredoxin
VDAYNSSQFPQALGFFMQDLAANPEDPMSHYYAGLCFHQLNRLGEATREYNWVLTHSQDPELIKRVQMGLQVLSRYQPAYAPVAAQPWGGQPAQGLPGQAPVQPNGAPGNAYPAAASGYPAPGQYVAAQPGSQLQTANPNFAGGQVIDFYTKWCGWCKKFAPMFHQAEQKYQGKLVFRSLDAEDPANKALVKRFRLKGYPTIIFLDANNKYLRRIDGAPQSMQEFETEIARAYPSLPAF